ncbi:MAG: BREX system ATP-binding domain-containing protein [Mycobacteriales bacterium]
MSTSTDRVQLPSGGATLGTGEYLEFLAKEYLHDYVSRGGAAVKLVVPGDDEVARGFTEGLIAAADGFVTVAVDASETKVHMVDQLFTAIARQIDWVALASDVVRRTYNDIGFPPRGANLDVMTVAAHHEVNPAELYRSIRRALEQAVLADTRMSHEFRVAMLRLCQVYVGRGDVDSTEQATVLGWLHGDRVPAAQLRAVSLYSRVARHNARPLLVSLARWLWRAGRNGLVLVLDVERLAVTRRPPAQIRDGFYYSKAATLDSYEVLRQLIDATDEFEGVFVAVLLPPEMLTDETRGLPAYTALQLRVADEVRDRRRPNPYAALVRLGVRLEAIR